MVSPGIAGFELVTCPELAQHSTVFDPLVAPIAVSSNFAPVFTDALKNHLAENGFDPLMGARPMARLIQDTIRAALADELLFGKLANGGRAGAHAGQVENADGS